MAHKSLLPKQRALTEQETQTSFEAWREGMIFHISLSDKSARFLSSGPGNLKTWSSEENRGFTDDAAVGANNPGVTEENKMNKEAKAALLNVVLGSIAGYAPVISSRFIKRQATSLESIWNRLRSFYGFRRTGSRVLELMDIKMDPNESREGLWERFYSFVEDQLLMKDGEVLHEGVKIETNEVFTPTLLNVIVTCWLNAVNPALPSMVRQRFTTQLRSNTLYSIREEVSEAIPAMISELEDKECNISRTGTYSRNRGKGRGSYYEGRNQPSAQTYSKKSCCLCTAAGRQSSNHFLSTCPFLPSDDKKFMTRAREVSVQDEEYLSDYEEESHYISTKALMINPQNIVPEPASDVAVRDVPNVRRVDVFASPTLEVKVGKQLSRWTLDSGAEANVIRIDECNRLGLSIKPTSKQATQGDGKTPLPTFGEVHFTAQRGHHKLVFSGLVVKDLDTAVLAGMPFHRVNHIMIDYSECLIVLENCCSIKFDPEKKGKKAHSSALKVAVRTCILPGEKIKLELPDSLRTKDYVAVEPRTTVPKDMPDWVGCHIVAPDAEGNIELTNTTDEPVLLSKHTQVAQVRATTEYSPVDIKPSVRVQHVQADTKSTKTQTVKAECKPSRTIDLESKLLSKEQKVLFKQIHEEFDAVFQPGIGCYNGHSGKFSHTINMGSSLPPQRKGRIPNYSKEDKDLLQEKFDYLLNEGVFSRAEDIDQPVEYVHPSFLVKKSSGGHRLVTSFGEVAEYAIPQPTSTGNIEHATYQIGQWNYLIGADVRDAYYHVPLSPESSKYVGVVTPYSGTLVYRRSVMGLPGSESALEELLSRIFKDMLKEGKMVKVADDMFFGASTVEELAEIWKEALRRLQLNGLRLNPTKTRICPVSATILGWVWTHGNNKSGSHIQSGSHRLNALYHCDQPSTVKGLRSYIGAYKYLSRVLPCYAEVLKPLEDICAGRESAEKIVWSDDMVEAFNLSKEHLKKAKPVALPLRSEQMHIVTDAAITPVGIAATLLVVRNNKLTVVGYFSAVLKKNQVKLLPCEAEALAIGASIKHWQYYIMQSSQRTRVLTDSHPCVLSYRKLQRGEFSSSPKVTTFLALASRHAVEVMHIKGSSNVFSDFASRHPVQCKSEGCSICDFVNNTANASVSEVTISESVREVTVSDIMSGKAKVPYTTKSSWLSVQKRCSKLSEVHRYLTTGATISKKNKKKRLDNKLTDVKRYLNVGVSVMPGGPLKGLLVVKQSTPFKPDTYRTVIPKKISDGLLTALHLTLEHPTANQLKLVFSRDFFCLNLDALAKKVSDTCFICSALKHLPSTNHKQSTSVPEDVIGCRFSVDVVNRHSQSILLARENITSYSDATIIPNEQASTLRDGILILMARLRSQQGPSTIIRTDPASSLRSLVNDKLLAKYNMSIELGEPKNKNKNPIAESGIKELHAEFKRIQPLGGKVSDSTLAQAVNNMNSRIRQNKLSASEAWTKRCMTTCEPLVVDDKSLIDLKYSQRLNSHGPSSKYSARGKVQQPYPAVEVGDLVHVFSDRSKLKTREKYLITSVGEDTVDAQKLVGSQFRGRSYNIKRSDVIITPKDTSRVSNESHSSENEEHTPQPPKSQEKFQKAAILK